MTTTKNTTAIENFLSGLNTEIDILNLINLEDINFSDPYNSIYKMIDENARKGLFNLSFDLVKDDFIFRFNERIQSLLKENISVSIEIPYSLSINIITCALILSLLSKKLGVSQ